MGTQFSVEVDAKNGTNNASLDGVELIFRNSNATGFVASAITDIYFSDYNNPTLLQGIGFDAANTTNPGVAFSIDTSGKFEPLAGLQNVPNFKDNLAFHVDPNNPPPKNGINPGEQLAVTFAQPSALAVIDALNKGSAVGGIQLGFHVQSLPTNPDSQAYFDVILEGGGGQSAVPLPSAAWGGLLLFAGMMVWRRVKPNSLI